MNAEVRSLKTPAEQALADAYAAARATLPGKARSRRCARMRSSVSTRAACRTGASRNGNTPICAR